MIQNWKIHFLLAYLSFLLCIRGIISTTLHAANVISMTNTFGSYSNNHIIMTTTVFNCTPATINYTIKNRPINSLLSNIITIPDGTTTLRIAPKNATTYNQVQYTMSLPNNNNMSNTTKFYCLTIVNVSTSVVTTKINSSMPDNTDLALSELITNPWTGYIPNYPNITNFQDDITFWDQFSQALFEQQNLARTNPRLYATYVQAQYNNFSADGKTLMLGNTKYTTFQGKTAWNEAINYLLNAAPVSPLTRVQCLDQAAQFMVADSATNSLTGHIDSLGRGPQQRQSYYCLIPYGGENIAWSFNSARNCIIQFIVDDGVASRGHRTNMYNPTYIQTGIWAGNYPGRNDIAVFEYLQKA